MSTVTEALAGGHGKQFRVDIKMDYYGSMRAEVRSGTFALSGEERPFGVGIRMAEGQRRPFVKVPRKDDRSEYRISRNHPLVEMMVEAVDNDPAFVYPALALLTEGHDGYADGREGAQKAIVGRHIR